MSRYDEPFIKAGYYVEFNSQVLISGNWDGPDCEWDWETERIEFVSKREAIKAFNAPPLTADTPIIRLFCFTRHRYDDGHIEEEEELLDERN